jgi:hypothetical protein
MILPGEIFVAPLNLALVRKCAVPGPRSPFDLPAMQVHAADTAWPRSIWQARSRLTTGRGRGRFRPRRIRCFARREFSLWGGRGDRRLDRFAHTELAPRGDTADDGVNWALLGI